MVSQSLPVTGSPPHTREALAPSANPATLSRITPAYAGSTVSTFSLMRPFRDHPRIRGKHTVWTAVCRTHSGSPPHTREALISQFLRCAQCRITPAYAGSTGASGYSVELHQDHPRIRGKHLMSYSTAPSPTGSPPHTREALIHLRDGIRKFRITPAYAGSTDNAPSGATEKKDHPRIRGKHHLTVSRQKKPWGSPPHTREAPKIDHI